ncbi:lipase, partial [Staphylococcus intermedius]
NEGYNVHEANIGAFSSNYDRAVELYYYVKGGRVDYGAAHAAKYGHHRYGRTYKGIMRDWEPGKKIHFIGHSMGGQTIRQMEEFLRNGNQEEIEYQRQHGGTISDLFTGGKDNMVASITTLGT